MFLYPTRRSEVLRYREENIKRTGPLSGPLPTKQAETIDFSSDVPLQLLLGPPANYGFAVFLLLPFLFPLFPPLLQGPHYQKGNGCPRSSFSEEFSKT